MVQKWNVAVQQELPGAMALEVRLPGQSLLTPTFTAGLQCVPELRNHEFEHQLRRTAAGSVHRKHLGNCNIRFR